MSRVMRDRTLVMCLPRRPKMADEDRGDIADPVKQIDSSRLLENRLFRFVQVRFDRSYEFKSGRCERLAHLAERMYGHADLERLAAIAEASPPARRVGLGIKVGNEYIRAWLRNSCKRPRDRNEVVDVTQGKGADQEVRDTGLEG